MFKTRILNKTLLFVIILWSISSIFFSYTDSASLSKSLGYLYKDLTKKIDNQDLYWKIVVEDLYQSNIIKQDAEELTNIIDAIKLTKYDIVADYDCNIWDEDMINILYSSDTDIRRKIWNIVQDNIDKNIAFPKAKDAIDSCKKFSLCTYSTDYRDSSFISSPVSVENCFDAINIYFQKNYKNLKNTRDAKQANDWDEVLFNGTLEDSEYDILYDIQQVGKLFFEWTPDAPRVVFYQFPEVKRNNNSLPDLTIDWFNPEDPWDVWTNDEDENQDNDESNDEIDETSNNIDNGLEWAENESQESEIDENITTLDELLGWNDLWNLINYNNPSSIIPGNTCIEPSEIQGKKISVIQEKRLTNEEQKEKSLIYIQELKEEIASLMCNNNLICEPGETDICGDCKTVTNENWEEITVTENDVEEVSEILSALEDSTDQKSIETVKNCYESCEWLWASDKIICIAKCSCGVRESESFFDPVKHPGMSPIFKVKFCTIPPKANTFSKKSTVKTIEAISNTLYAIVASLRNSGQLTTQVKTKEYLDTARARSDFANQVSFTINVDKKRLFDNKLEITQKEEQESLNELFQVGALNMGSDINLPSERNKYIVVWDPAQYKTEEDPKYSYASEDAYSINNASLEQESLDMEMMFSDLKKLQIAQMEHYLSNFLEQNRTFRNDFDEMILWIKKIAESLKNQ